MGIRYLNLRSSGSVRLDRKTEDGAALMCIHRRRRHAKSCVMQMCRQKCDEVRI